MNEPVPRSKESCTRIRQWHRLMRPDVATGSRRSTAGIRSLKAEWNAVIPPRASRATREDRKAESFFPIVAPRGGASCDPSLRCECEPARPLVSSGMSRSVPWNPHQSSTAHGGAEAHRGLHDSRRGTFIDSRFDLVLRSLADCAGWRPTPRSRPVRGPLSRRIAA